MSRRYPSLIFVLMFVGALIGSCAGLTTKPDATPRSPLEIAELTYVQASYFYEAGMSAVHSLRAQGRVSDAQWSRIEQAQTIVRASIPRYSAALRLWRATGSKPANFESAAADVRGAADEVAAVLAEVSR